MQKSKRSIKDIVMDFYGKAGILIILLIMVIGLSVGTDTFLTYRNLINVLRQITFYAMIGFGEMAIIITGGFDMSAGSIVGLTSVLTAMVAQNASTPGYRYILGSSYDRSGSWHVQRRYGCLRRRSSFYCHHGFADHMSWSCIANRRRPPH